MSARIVRRGRATWARAIVCVAPLLACSGGMPEAPVSAPAPAPVKAPPASPPVNPPPAAKVVEPIELVVRDLDGAPLPGATVVHEAKDDAVTELVADAAGQVRIPGPGWLRVRASGHLELSAAYPHPNATGEVRLLPESTVALRVVDAKTGAPIAGATIASDSNGHVPGETDAQGRIELRGLAPGRRLLTARAPGRAGDGFVALGVGERASRELAVHPRFAVAGRVVIDDGTTCTSGHLRLMAGVDGPTQGCPVCAGADASFSAPIAADGTFRVELPPHVRHGVEVHCDDAVPDDPGAVLVTDADVGGLRWKVRRGQQIRGRAVDEGGRPLPGIDIMLRDDDGENVAGATTDGDGRFTLGGLVAGEYEMLAFGERSDVVYEDERMVDVQDGAPTEVLVTLKDEPAHRGRETHEGDTDSSDTPSEPELRGIVRDARGAPVEGAILQIVVDRARDDVLAGVMSGWNGAAPRRSDAGGAFSVRTPPGVTLDKSGDYESRLVILAHVVGGGLGVAILTRPADATEIVVGPPGTLAGSVRDRRGAPVLHFGLDVGSSRPRPVYVHAPDGRFELPGLAPGDLRLRIHAGEADTGRRLSIKPGSNSAGAPFEVRGTIEELLIDMHPITSGGDPIGCTVVFGPLDGSPRVRARVSEDGFVTFDGVPAGPSRIDLPACTAGTTHFPAQSRHVVVRGDERASVRFPVVGREGRASAWNGDLGLSLARVAADRDPAMVLPTVARVRAGGPAAAAGIVVGDRIAWIDGHRVTGRDAALAAALLQVRRGDEVGLELADGRALRLRAR